MFQSSINPSSYDSRVEIYHPKEEVPPKLRPPVHRSHRFKDHSSSSNLTKEILESNKTLDFPSSKIIHEKTSGSFKTFSYSYLDTSSCSKSKAKAAKHHKHSFKTSFEPPDSSCYSRFTPSRNRNLIATRLANGEPFRVYHDPSYWMFIAMLLFCLSIVKLLHHPFDKGRHDIHTFMLKSLI